MTPPNSPDDFRLSVMVSPGFTFERSKVLLARAHFTGKLELLTAAWEKLPGYERREFAGKTLRQLMGSRKPAAVAVAAILDDLNLADVDLEVRGRDGGIRHLRLHRWLDQYEHSMYIVADEMPEASTKERAAVLSSKVPS